MVKAKEICLATRGSITTLKDEGYSSREIGEKLGVPYSTVNYTLKRFKKTKSFYNLPISDRPRATTTEIDKNIINFIEESDQPNANNLVKMLPELNIAKISPLTVQRRLNEDGLMGRAPIKKPLLTLKHIKAKYKFGLKHQSCTVDDWKRVLFTDETKLNQKGSDGKVWTWRRT
jgi:IS30 family transposase